MSHHPSEARPARGIGSHQAGRPGTMARMDITLTDEPTRLAALVRRTVPMSDLKPFYDSVYTHVAATLASTGNAPAGPALGWLHHDGSTEALDVAAGFPVAGLPTGTLEGDVEVLEIPGGRALVAIHEGPYADLPGAWEALVERLGAEGLSPRGDTVEEYLTQPEPDGDPALNRTRLVMMVR